MNWFVLVRGSRELLQCGISYFVERSSTSEMKQEPLFHTGLTRDFQAVTQARRVILMWKYHHLCLTAAHQPLLLITCLPVTFLLKSAFGPTGKWILYLFCENLSESLLSHLNRSL